MADNHDDASTTSDVELEGMEVDDIEEEEEEEEDVPAVAAAVPPSSPAVNTKLKETERRDLEAARKERMELIQAESKKIQPAATKQDRLAYLMAQSDVFAHFLAGMFAQQQHWLVSCVCVVERENDTEEQRRIYLQQPLENIMLLHDTSTHDSLFSLLHTN